MEKDAPVAARKGARSCLAVDGGGGGHAGYADVQKNAKSGHRQLSYCVLILLSVADMCSQDRDPCNADSSV